MVSRTQINLMNGMICLVKRKAYLLYSMIINHPVEDLLQESENDDAIVTAFMISSCII